MSLADFDATATARRIQDIADAARKAFEAHAEQSDQLNAAAREAAAKEQAELEASEKRRAEAEAEAAKERAADEKTEDEQPKTPPKPATLSLGAEEFKLDREARRAAEETTPAETKPAEPKPTDAKPVEDVAEGPAPKPATTLKLGARDDDEAPVKRDKPVRKRPPAPEADDDMSGRTWLR